MMETSGDSPDLLWIAGRNAASTAPGPDQNERCFAMADGSPTPGIRPCATCGRDYPLNPKYSAAQKAKSRFCSRVCASKHGGYMTREYKSWNAMMQRCTNPNATGWDQYGGRGIAVCEEWLGPKGYHQFVKDMGPRPLGMTLDRIDTNKGYGPGNTRWATPQTQQNNRRVTKLITHEGITLSQAQWTQRRGLSRNAVAERLRDGWSIQDAVTTPAPEPKTQCPQGHLYDEENTYFTSAGHRQCLICRRERSRKWNAAKAAARQENRS